MIEKQLAHASGALDDIYVLATSCVAPNAARSTHELAQAVIRRLLCSADQPRKPPPRFAHDWERELWRQHESGEIQACGEDH